MHRKKGHVISMHAKCCCTSMMSSRPYRCCGDAEDALFTQSHTCNHRLHHHATCIIHYAHNCKQITHLHVQAITDINACCICIIHMHIQKSQVQIIQTFCMHHSQCTQTKCMHTSTCAYQTNMLNGIPYSQNT